MFRWWRAGARQSIFRLRECPGGGDIHAGKSPHGVFPEGSRRGLGTMLSKSRSSAPKSPRRGIHAAFPRRCFLPEGHISGEPLSRYPLGAVPTDIRRGSAYAGNHLALLGSSVTGLSASGNQFHRH
jgi:hypothetical protein